MRSLRMNLYRDKVAAQASNAATYDIPMWHRALGDNTIQDPVRRSVANCARPLFDTLWEALCSFDRHENLEA
jgi:hypothetical protein